MTPELVEQYTRVLTTPSDMKFHLPKLQEFSSKVNRVAEIGVKDMNSSWGLLSGKPRWMVSYDLYPPTNAEMLETFKQVAVDNNVLYEFFIQDSLLLELPEVDFLFIDSYHTYSHLKEELKIHPQNVTTYIGFHDTYLFGFKGQPNSRCELRDSKGLLNALNEFLKEHREWEIIYNTDKCNGLTIIERVS